MKYRLLACFLFFLICLPAFSQTSSKRCQWIKLTASPFALDTLTVVPGSITLSGAAGAGLHYEYDPARNQFRFLVPQSAIPLWADSAATRPSIDSVLVCYRVLPLNLSLARYKRKAGAADTLQLPGIRPTEMPRPKEEIFNTPGLNKTGTVTRGVSVGNRQNVFVNSALNLQLEGKLSEDIAITAAITDQNIPFQPEGNTQQLQEFDKVYITLQHRRWNLTGGDVVLQNKPTHFLRFYKNVQGGMLEVNQGQGGPRAASTTLAASVAKGKFASVAIPATEGVQGPYRLPGPNGEKFILILANSEKVYLDGQLLVRGYDFDYVIDYNQAEITFTARHLITRYSRIRVDFEFSDRNYNRSVYHASHYQDLNKLHLNFNLYQEADNPNNLLALDLANSEKLLLQTIGDSLNQAFTTGVEAVAYDRELLLYKDSTVVVNGSPQTVYVYTQDSTLSNYFTLRFTDVGAGRGDYIAQNNSINGRIYRYVAPVDGSSQGRFAPVRILPTPRKKQMMTAGGHFQVDKETRVFLETAMSQNDLNRFSKNDSGDDQGKAMRVGYAVENKPVGFLRDYKWRSNLSYEYTDRNFEAIDRFRDIDFNRDWSLPINPDTRNSDNIFQFSAGLYRNPENLLGYRISRRYRHQEVAGVQHYLDFARQFRGLLLRSGFFLLDATGRKSQSDWFRGNIDLSYPLARVVPGYTYRFDKNRVNARSNPDSVITSAMYFDEHTFYVRSPDTAATQYSLQYTFRQDRPPGEGQLREPNYAQNYRGTLQTKIGQNQDLNLIANYRHVQSRDSANESSILATASWLGSFLNQHVRAELDYTVGTGREPRRQYEFVAVAPGQGTHYLIDGGNPQNLNDYFEAQVPDARYRTHIKVFLPTDQYVKAYHNQLNYRLNTAMPRSWREKGGWQEQASRLSAVTYININKKNADPDLWRRFNPFSLEVEDNLLISLISTFRNTVFYNRSDPTFGLDFTTQETQQKTLLANGTDIRTIGASNLTVRYNLNQFFSSRLSLGRNTRASRSDYLTTKNFRILGNEVAPELSYQPGNMLRLTGNYVFTQRKNLGSQENPEEAILHETGIETRWSQVNKRTLSGQLKFIRVAYSGEENAAVAYEMLNALRPGNNLTWNLAMQQRLSNGLNLTFNYDGRKPNRQAVIHAGRMQVSVLF